MPSMKLTQSFVESKLSILKSYLPYFEILFPSSEVGSSSLLDLKNELNIKSNKEDDRHIFRLILDSLSGQLASDHRSVAKHIIFLQSAFSGFDVTSSGFLSNQSDVDRVKKLSNIRKISVEILSTNKLFNAAQKQKGASELLDWLYLSTNILNYELLDHQKDSFETRQQLLGKLVEIQDSHVNIKNYQNVESKFKALLQQLFKKLEMITEIDELDRFTTVLTIIHQGLKSGDLTDMRSQFCFQAPEARVERSASFFFDEDDTSGLVSSSVSSISSTSSRAELTTSEPSKSNWFVSFFMTLFHLMFSCQGSRGKTQSTQPKVAVAVGSCISGKTCQAHVPEADTNEGQTMSK